MRILPALGSAALLTLTLASLAVAAPNDRPSPVRPAAPHGPQQDLELDLKMVKEDGQTLTRSYPSTATKVQAVVTYSGARGQKLAIKIVDYSGITIKRQETPALSGSGVLTAEATIGDFVARYRQAIDESVQLAEQSISELDARCASVPTVPTAWPPTDPTNAYSVWLKETLTRLETARTASASVTRTAQSLLAMASQAGNTEVVASLSTLRNRHVAMDAILGEISHKFQPPQSSGTATPPVPVRPTPQEGCALMATVKEHATEAAKAWTAAKAIIPADLTGWQLPKSSAQYDPKGAFLGCLQYSTVVAQIVDGEDLPSLDFVWGVGDPGAPALVFPSPDEADASGLGLLSVAYPQGADAMYAQSVLVPDLNRQAAVTAFVTDASCLSVDGATLSFLVEPAGAATVNPASAVVDEGVASATLTSGNIAADGTISVTVGEGDARRTARGTFRVIGPAKTVEFKGLRNKEINRGALLPKDRVISISVFATDEKGQRVADGTMMRFEIIKDPGEIVEAGVLAYDRTDITTGETETVILGTSVTLQSFNGSNARFFPCEPGYSCDNIYLAAGDKPNGRFILKVTVDGVEKTEKFSVVSKSNIFLPIIIKSHEVRVTPGPRITLAPPAVNGTPGPFFR